MHCIAWVCLLMGAQVAGSRTSPPHGCTGSPGCASPFNSHKASVLNTPPTHAAPRPLQARLFLILSCRMPHPSARHRPSLPSTATTGPPRPPPLPNAPPTRVTSPPPPPRCRRPAAAATPLRPVHLRGRYPAASQPAGGRAGVQSKGK